MSLRQVVASPPTIAWLRALAVPVSSPTAESELRALVDDATGHCPVCQAIRGNIAMPMMAQFNA